MPAKKKAPKVANPPLFTQGAYGYTVSLMRKPGKHGLWLRWTEGGNYKWRKLGHDDVEQGQRECTEMASIRMRVSAHGEAAADGARAPLTLAALFAEYAQAKHQPRKMPDGARLPPLKSAAQIAKDERWMGYWQTRLGSTRAVETIDADAADEYTAWRREQGIEDTTIGHEHTFMKGVLEWGTRRRSASGERLVMVNGLAEVRRLRNIKRNAPNTAWHRFLRVYRHSVQADKTGRLRCLLMLAHAHGWRITAFLKMWAADIDLRPAPFAPDGQIRRRQANDKKKRPDEWLPMSPESRKAAVRLLRISGAVGTEHPFSNGRGPWQYQYAVDLLHLAELMAGQRERIAYLREIAPVLGERVTERVGTATYTLAEYMAKHGARLAANPRHAARIVGRVNAAMGTEWRASLEPEPGHGFHGLRRKWGKDRKHLPLADVARAGGWDRATLLNYYNEDDPATTLQVVTEGRRKGKPGG